MATNSDYSLQEIIRRIMDIQFNRPPTREDLAILEWELADAEQRVTDLKRIIERVKAQTGESDS